MNKKFWDKKKKIKLDEKEDKPAKRIPLRKYTKGGKISSLTALGSLVMIVLAAVTFFCIVFYTNQKGIMITGILLFIHPVMYFVCGLSWYVPLLADFNLLLSLEVVHYGFYLSLLCSSLMCWFYVKKGRKDMENNRLKRRKDKMAI